MGPDQAVELARRLLIEAMLLSAPMLIAGALVSLLLSIVQTVTSIQEQTLTAVPRLIIVFVAGVVAMPWFVNRLVLYTLHLWGDFHQFLG